MVGNTEVRNSDQDEFPIVDSTPIRLDRLGIERNSKSEFLNFSFSEKLAHSYSKIQFASTL